jgi:DNA invertase Pin-like site-specific DNA recombinase
MKAILLVRVSTQIQNYEAQTKDLIEYAKSKGFTEFKIIETKETGFANLEVKLGTNEMFEFYKSNPDYKTVFATELSRISRRQSILHQIKEWFIKNKVQFYLKDTNYSLFDDTGNISPAGDIMFTLYGFFAEQEMAKKKERFKREKTLLLEKGLSHSGKLLFGYKKKAIIELKKNALEEDEENAKIVRTIFNWYLNGIDNKFKNPSIKTITLEAIKRGYPKYCHSKRNVNKLLKEEAYTGFKITNNKRKNPNYTGEENEEKYIVTNFKIKYPSIIDRETFDLVQQKLLKNNTNVDKSSKHTTILSKLIKCSNCDNHFNANYRIVNGINKSTYRCSSRSSAKPCDNKQSISMSMIDSAIWNLIKTDLNLLAEQIKINNPDTLELNYKTHLEKLLKKRNELNVEYQLELKTLEIIKRVKNVNINDSLIKFEQNTNRIDKELGKIDKEISKVNLFLNMKQNKNDDLSKTISENLDKIESSKELLKEYINLFVENIRIIYHNKKYTILQVCLNTYSNVEKFYFPNSMDYIQMDDAELETFNSILLDKRQTLSIKMFKSSKLFHPNGEDSIQIGRFTFLIPKMIDEVQNVEKFPILKEVKKVNYSKLRVH